MGLLGLLNLIYFAEHYLEQAKFLIFSKRNYPWAATGINITSMLFDLLEIKQGNYYFFYFFLKYL